MWFWIITATGMFVAASQFLPALRGLGSVAAFLLAVISVLAVVLTLLAATIGGSFELDNREALLVFGFFMIAVSGFLLARINRKPESESAYQGGEMGSNRVLISSCRPSWRHVIPLIMYPP